MQKISEAVAQKVISEIIDGEFSTAQSNQATAFSDYESYVDMLDCERGDAEYEWMSNVVLPEFTSIMLTQSSIDVGQYFTTRDFVEVYLEDESPESKAKAEAAKECINRTLNRRKLYHYLKYVRARQIANLNGTAWAECWWEKQARLSVDGFAVDEENESVSLVFADKVFKDCFNYDIYDPRNVFTDNEFSYSAQEKDWVILRSAKSLDQLEREKEEAGYFDLERLKKSGLKLMDTDTHKDTEPDDENYNATDETIPKYFDILKRFGKYWAIVKERDPVTGLPNDVEIGVGEDGKPLDDAEWVECIMVFAVADARKFLIAFHQTPYVDAAGIPYRPIIRGQCYPHPVRDGGFGDGKATKELQDTINDTYNVSNDRTMLATTPAFKVRRYANEDNMSIYVEPGHGIELDDPANDLIELKVDDNTIAALNQIAMLRGKMQELTSIYPTTMGAMPELSSTTATAVAASDQRSNTRANFKGLTFEFTFLEELYWMILQMTWRFAEPETAVKLMGREKVYNFDPDADYYYKPLSQTLEPEHSKAAKAQRYIQVMGMIAQSPHPSATKAFNYLLVEFMKLMGDEVSNVEKILLDEGQQMQQGQGVEQQPMAGGPQASNQAGIMQSPTEAIARETGGYGA